MSAGLHIRQMSVRLRDGKRTFVLSVPSLDLARGEIFALIGPSGSGKTLLLELMGLLRQPEPGATFALETHAGETCDLFHLWKNGPRGRALAHARGRVFGFVPQTGGLLPFLSVDENIALPQKLTGRIDVAWRDTLIKTLRLDAVRRLRPGALSIGERQRCAIARALAHRPDFVIADEPTAPLDPENADIALGLLLDLARAQGSGVILSSHDIERIERLGLPKLALCPGSGGENIATSTLERML